VTASIRVIDAFRRSGPNALRVLGASGAYWKVIMSVRLRVVALGFKGAFAKFALPEFKTL
jgi:hypothetical protein